MSLNQKGFWIWIGVLFLFIFTINFMFGRSLQASLAPAAIVSAVFIVAVWTWRAFRLARVLDWISRHSPLKKLPKTLSVIFIAFFLVLMLSIGAVFILFRVHQPPSEPSLTYTEFIEKVLEKSISENIILKKEKKFYYPRNVAFFTDLTDEKRKWTYFDSAPGSIPPVSAEEWLRLRGHNVALRDGFPIGGILLQVLTGFTMSIPFFFFMWLIAGRGLASMGEEFAGLRSSKILLGKKITFDNVGGMEPVKEMLRGDYLDFLEQPKSYKKIGATMPKGVLLHGLPGVGKTLIARAFAGEADVPTYMVSGSDFHYMLVGVGANRAERLFDQAKRNAPSVLIIDEIDSAAPKRGGMDLGGADKERASLTNKILSLMDELDKENIPVIVFGLTNVIDALDPALLRPKRFDNNIYVPPPDFEGRVQILQVHTEDPDVNPPADDVDFEELARLTPGWSGSKLAVMVNKARIHAVKDGREIVCQKDFLDIRTLIELGPKTPREITEEEKERIAYHESGHALCAFILPEVNPLQSLTLETHGTTLGHAAMPPERDHNIESAARLMTINKVFLAGHAVEVVIYGEPSTGSGRDIESATANTRDFVFRGMDKELGPVSIYAMKESDSSSYTMRSSRSDLLAGKGEERVQDILKDCLNEMVEIFSQPEWKEVLKRVAEKLLAETTLTGNQVRELIPEDLLESTRNRYEGE